MESKEKKEYRIVMAGMNKKVYDKVIKLADKNRRTHGKQAEIMIEELIELKKL